MTQWRRARWPTASPSWTAEYTDDFGDADRRRRSSPGAGPIPTGAEGVRATGTRTVTTTFSRIFGFEPDPGDG